jgi:hypothetical protein
LRERGWKFVPGFIGRTIRTRSIRLVYKSINLTFNNCNCHNRFIFSYDYFPVGLPRMRAPKTKQTTFHFHFKTWTDKSIPVSHENSAKTKYQLLIPCHNKLSLCHTEFLIFLSQQILDCLNPYAPGLIWKAHFVSHEFLLCLLERTQLLACFQYSTKSEYSRWQQLHRLWRKTDGRPYSGQGRLSDPRLRWKIHWWYAVSSYIAYSPAIEMENSLMVRSV